MTASAQKKLEPRDIAIPPAARIGASRYLDEALGETYRLMVQTQILHWNVKGPLFLAAHELSEQHYKELFEAIDVIAERSRALGRTTPGTATSFPPAVEFHGRAVSAEEAIADLVAAHEQLVKLLRDAVDILEEEGDNASADLFVERIAFHEKAIWMWRTLASGSSSAV